MTHTDVIAGATALSDTIGTTTHRRTFQHAVNDFVGVLVSVLDYPAAEFSIDEIGLLRRLSEGVIERIELRLNTPGDSTNVQVVLVEAVYEIRRRLELIDEWRRHSLGIPLA